MSSEQSRTSEDSDRLRRIINAGTEILGSSTAGVASAAVGFFASGSAEAAIGGATGAALIVGWKALGSEISKRLLGPREEARVGFVFAHAAVEIQERIRQGEALRDDGFFESQGAGRSSAEEVAESVLLKSQREPEEKKLPFMAHLLANLAFNSAFDGHMAHQFIRYPEQLTYRQLCVLSLVSSIDDFGLRQRNYNDYRQFSEELGYLLYECKDLEDRSLLFIGSFAGEGRIEPGTEGYDPGGKNIIRRRQSIRNPTARRPEIPDIVPGSMQLQPIGIELCDLMELRSIPREDLEEVAKLLR